MNEQLWRIQFLVRLHAIYTSPICKLWTANIYFPSAQLLSFSIKLLFYAVTKNPIDSSKERTGPTTFPPGLSIVAAILVEFPAHVVLSDQWGLT